ncbi:hypothetical protein CVV72_10755 [Amycolatopsis sp. TNS106]|nr:hypothetical protein CVV72_10755 [Amycolatopsis sp. TNS106]
MCTPEDDTDNAAAGAGADFRVGDLLRGHPTYRAQRDQETFDGVFSGAFGDDLGLTGWPEVHGEEGRRVFLDPSRPITIIRPVSTSRSGIPPETTGGLATVSAQLLRTARDVVGDESAEMPDTAIAQALAAVLAEPALAHFLRLTVHQRRWIANIAEQIGTTE